MARKNKYQRKTVELYKYHALWIMFLLAIMFIAIMIMTKHIEAQSEFISPLSANHVNTVYETVYVEKPVYIQPESIEDKIRATFVEDPDTAVRVAFCESSMNPRARNSTSSARGIYQIMQSWHKINEKWLFNEDVNIAVAYQLWQEQGWRPWEASRHCWGVK